MNKTAKWLTILLAVTLLGVGVGALTAEYTYQNSGSIATVGVTVTWLNGTLVETVDWGVVNNGTAYVMEPMNVTNIENTPVNLTLSTSNWSPSIITLSLIWNYTDGTVLQPDQSIIVQLEQTITATGDWSYTTVIQATSTE